MLKPNTRYKELKDTYLFNTIYRKTNEYLEANPDKQVLRMGVGDVSLPLLTIRHVSRVYARGGCCRTSPCH